jgi:CheY-like chemotaxis protein
MNRALAPSFSIEQRPVLKILLGEDNAEMRRLLSLVLQGDGHDVVETRDAGELLDTLAATLIEPAERRFDLVICEQSLPGISGLNLLAGLRSRAARTAFVLITGEEMVAARARRLGAAILESPFDVQAIRSAIRASWPPPA